MSTRPTHFTLAAAALIAPAAPLHAAADTGAPARSDDPPPAHVEVADGGTAEIPPGLTGDVTLSLPGRAQRDATDSVMRYDDPTPLRDYAGDPGTADLTMRSPSATAPAIGAAVGPSTGAGGGCFGAAPQRYQHWPLRGCSLVPPSAGYANELCFGESTYFCREVWGHPQLNLDPNANYVIYKSNVAHYSPTSGPGAAWYHDYGMEAVDRTHGWVFEGCFEWAKITYGDGSSDFWTTCDYKQGRNGPLPLLQGTARDHFYDTLRRWSGHMYDNEFNCAVTITGSWTGAAETNDVTPACTGIFSY